MIYNYVIYHKGCFDGFASFVILERSGKMSEDAKIFPDVPSAKYPPKDIEGKDVIIMDVAYKYDVLKEIFLSAHSVTFIDHHVTIHDDVLKLKEKYSDKSENIKIIYDESECGSSLTWKYLHKKKKLPKFLKYIHANDVGKWDLYKNTYSFMAGLEVNYKTEPTAGHLKKWNELFDTETVKRTIKKGRIYREYSGYLLDLNVNKYAMMSFPSNQIYEEFSEYFKKPAQYKVAVSFNPCPDNSLLGNKMMKEINCDFVMFVSPILDRKEYVLSMRSIATDVGSIAKMFGGGGHNLAAACSFPMSRYNIEDLFMKDSLPRQRK